MKKSSLTRIASSFLLFASATTPLFAQGKDMGPAQQYYKQNTKFHLSAAPHQAGGDVKWSVAKDGRVVVEKDEYAILENDVKITYQDVVLHADKVTLNLKTKDAVAAGHVIVDQGPNRVSADHAVFNLDSKTGTFFNATAAMDPSLYFVGEKIEKVADDRYRLTNGIFTSCDLDKPAWSFRVAEADITLDDYARMKDLSFRAHNIPIFWTPRLVWPTKRDRAQGLLIPRIGLSSQFGQRLELGYFIPIGDSVDTTIYADVNTKGYNGAGFDLRYLPTPNIKTGELRAFAVHDPEGKKMQWQYEFKHAQDALPGNFRGVVDVQDFSDLDFFRKWDRDPRIHTLSQIYSSAYLTKNRDNYSLNILADRRDIVLGRENPSDPNSPELKQTFEQLPSLQFRMYPDRVRNSPFYFSLESSLSHLRTSGLLSGPTADYGRADIFPTVSLALRTPAWLSIKPQLSVRETYYTSSLDPATLTSASGQQAITDSLSRFYAQAQVEVVGPSFSRVYNENFGGFSKFKHIIEPRFRFVHTTDVTNQDRIIRFDSVDTPFLPLAHDFVEYSLTQRLIGKESGAAASSREILSFSLRQTISFSNDLTSTGSDVTGQGTLAGVDANQRFSPLVASLHVNPYSSITFDANATFGNISHQLDQTSISANLVGGGKNADKYLSFSWFSTLQNPQSFQTFGVDTSTSQIRLNTGSSLLRDRLRADVQLNFDAKTGKFLEQRFLIGGNGSCYGLAFEFRRYLVYDPLPRSLTNYGISLTLKNVGTITTH
jgi:LPS-assembly protein